MSAVGRWFVTPHAVQRYRDRIDPQASYEKALGVLIHLTARAHFVRPTREGAELWRLSGADGRLRFIVRASELGALPQLLTVLPAFGSGASR